MVQYRVLLYKIFHFHPWHISEEKPYAVWLINKINGMNINGRIVEIGCGLGDISAGIKSWDKIGYDIDKRVIRAAKFTHPFLKTKVGTFNDITGQKISLLIAVNFLHAVNEDMFRDYFRRLIVKNVVDRIIVDEVPCPPYEYAHDYENYFSKSGYVLEYRSKGFEVMRGRRKILIFRKNEKESVDMKVREDD